MSARRALDLLLAVPALVVAAPLIGLGALAVKLSSPGPAFYRAQRVARGGGRFTMLKLRTMHLRQVAGSAITASRDPRIFPVGRLLRALKIDELPQLLNIVGGEMAIVGPRPEDPAIVERDYDDLARATLEFVPGLASPGSLLYYCHAEDYLAHGVAEQRYREDVLPVKAAVDLVYCRSQTAAGDLRVIAWTALVVAARLLGFKPRYVPRELPEALRLLEGTKSGAVPEWVPRVSDA